MFIPDVHEIQNKVPFLRRYEKDPEGKEKEKNESDDDESEEEFDEYEKLFTGNIYQFLDEHPGSEYSHLAELELEVIPKISLPGGKLCDVALLEVTEATVDEKVMCRREDYAKMALLMFYPFRTLGDLQLDGSYWKLFWRELCLHKEGKKYSFWTKGFEILQNIQDRFTVEKQMRRAKDPVLLTTQCQQKQSKEKHSREEDNGPNIPDIAEFCTMFE